jgi:hypothetical protein
MTELSYPELVTAASSLIALVISFVTMVRERKLDEDQRKLRRVTEELSRKQLDRLKEEDFAAHRTRVVAELAGESGNRKFYIKNVGRSPAKDVEFEIIDCDRSPLIPAQVDEVLPLKVLQPGSEISLLAAITMGSPPIFNTRVTWTNVDGSRDAADFPIPL